MYEGHTVGVVIPAYNEEGFVGDVVRDVPSYVDRIYIIDDCSTDGTWAEILRSSFSGTDVTNSVRSANEPGVEIWRGHRVLGSESPPDAVADGGAEPVGPVVVPIQHDRNRGVGGAITTGYRRALRDDVDVAAVMAGDGQMDPNQLERLLDPIVEGRAEYAKGNRLLGREHASGMSPFRLIGNVTLSILTKISSGYWAMLDPQNGYTAISRDALEAIDLDGLYTDYGFSNDLLAALNTRKVTIADVAMPAVYGDERSHIDYRTFVPNLSWLLFRRFLRRLGVRYLYRDFHPLAVMYAVGILGTAAALVGLLTRRNPGPETDSTPSNVLSALTLAVVSTTCLLLAMIFDREANGDLVVTER